MAHALLRSLAVISCTILWWNEFVFALILMSEPKRRSSKIIVEGRGSIVWDINGNQYIDAAATLSANIVGHGRQEMLDAILSQMRKLEYIFGM